MKKPQFLSFAFIVFAMNPAFAKAPLQLYIDGSKGQKIDVTAPKLDIDSKIELGTLNQKNLVRKDSIDDQQISTIISFLNNNKEKFVRHEDKEEVGKLYFNPQFGNEGAGRVFFSKESGAVRLQQAFYYRDKDGKTTHVPFEGAEVVVFVKKVKGEGEIRSINSSLINSSEYERFIPLLSQLGDGSFSNLSHLAQDKRDHFLNVLLEENNVVESWEKMAQVLYPDKRIKSRAEFVDFAKSDEMLVSRVLRSQKDSVELVFSSLNFREARDSRKSFELVYSLKAPFGIPKNLKINVDENANSVFHEVSSLEKHVKVNIYRGTGFNMKKSKKRSEESSKAKDFKIKTGIFRQEDYDLALINLSKVVEEFKASFNWNGFDNKGSDLDATVRYKGSKLTGTSFLRQNAAWVGAPYNQFIFGRGGDELNDFLEAYDVIGHEYCHAVVAHTSNLDSSGQPGALNEHVCDILGVGVESDITNKAYDFKIGEIVVQNSDKPLRNFLEPDSSASPQASHQILVDSLFSNCEPSNENDSCGVHYSNGVPNKAVGMSIKAIGWKRMKDVVFDTVTKRLRSSSDFVDYKNQMVASCLDNGSISNQECSIIEKNFNDLGVK